MIEQSKLPFIVPGRGNKVGVGRHRKLPQKTKWTILIETLPQNVVNEFEEIIDILKEIDPMGRYLRKAKGIITNRELFRFIRNDELKTVRNLIKQLETVRVSIDRYRDNTQCYTAIYKRTPVDYIYKLAVYLEENFPVRIFLIPYVANIESEHPTATLKLKACFKSKNLKTYAQTMYERAEILQGTYK